MRRQLISVSVLRLRELEMPVFYTSEEVALLLRFSSVPAFHMWRKRSGLLQGVRRGGSWLFEAKQVHETVRLMRP